MAIDEEMRGRMRAGLDGLDGVGEQAMFGGVCFLLDGNMLGGVRRDKDGVGRFMFRVGDAGEAEAGQRPGAEPMVMGGRRMRGFYFVQEDDCDDAALAGWIALAHRFVSGLPPKKKVEKKDETSKKRPARKGTARA